MILPKGAKARIEAAAKDQGMSRNEYIVTAVREKYIRDTGKELMQKEEKGVPGINAETAKRGYPAAEGL